LLFFSITNQIPAKNIEYQKSEILAEQWIKPIKNTEYKDYKLQPFLINQSIIKHFDCVFNKSMNQYITLNIKIRHYGSASVNQGTSS
jgi:hypothetical protein